MVRCKSNTRFLNIKSLVLLTQTDTTVGFISQNNSKLSNIKSRPESKPFIKVYNSLSLIKSRVPKSKKKLVRRAKKTTFIIKNKAFRVDSSYKNSQILRDLNWHYSTSANEIGKNFNRDFCEHKTDIIIEDKYGLHELSSSKLLKINDYKIRSLR
ncbi:hypothetical protein FJR48_03900 [Sulfurimonas lithotrophica]|uniref:Sua5 YciO YrdC YwlC family protein n=1 Tax=Sulfurimonas lithotrophica TaxID=2590022 RepID=A0A5P8NZN7_9BACT|nr:hypothetical protein [Sulfurimonas lithotrophica]QFR48908.1 hypothetical protein FJR48_03900 [Sulfurimonas lithotrophica]